MILLAKNRKGWEVLNRLSSHAWGNSYTSFILRTPTYISFFENVMKTIGKGNIIVSSACIGGILGSDILNYLAAKDPFMYDNIVNKVKWLSSLVAEGDFYLEVQPALYEEQKAYNSFLLELGKKLNLPVMIATDAHYLNKDDFLLHHTFLNSQRDNATVRETENFYKYTYFMPIDEIKFNLSAFICTIAVPVEHSTQKSKITPLTLFNFIIVCAEADILKSFENELAFSKQYQKFPSQVNSKVPVVPLNNSILHCGLLFIL